MGLDCQVIAAFCVMVLYVFALLMKQITDMVLLGAGRQSQWGFLRGRITHDMVQSRGQRIRGQSSIRGPFAKISYNKCLYTDMYVI